MEKIIITPQKREENVLAIDAMLSAKGFSLYEGVLAFMDLFSTALAVSMQVNVPDKTESAERINAIRNELIGTLNKHSNGFLAEDMFILSTIMTESILMGIDRENEMNETKEPS